MADFKTYDQAVADGDIYVWSAGGDKLAKKERFDANTKFTVDNQEALKNGVEVLVKQNQTSLAQNLAKINALSEDVNKQLITLGEKATTSELSIAVEGLNKTIANIQQQLADLDKTYATDSEVATIISGVNEAWAGADGSLKTTLSSLIGNRYTKAESDTIIGTQSDLVSALAGV
jgi:hypothetical protein